jgi:hypothetical protein
MPNENDINLLELVKKIPLGLPMPKESVIIGNKTIVFRKGKNEINVRKFVEGLIKRLKPKSDKNLKDLNIFALHNLEQYKNVKEIE